MTYKIAACCQIGYIGNKDKFEQYDSCSMGTVRRIDMLKLCGLGKDDVDQLTDDLVNQHFAVMQSKLLPVVLRNLKALRMQLSMVASMPEPMRAFRISSDLLPLYTHPVLGKLYDSAVLHAIQCHLHNTGLIIRKHDIRVSSHPSQFTTLSSDRDEVIDASIIDLEHHVMIMESLGLTPTTCVINIHANGKSFTLPERARHLFPWLSLENDEKKAGHAKVLQLCETYGIRYVFDHHHYYCETGDLIDFHGTEWERIKRTWHGQRPLMHLSQARGTTNFRDQCAHSDTITDMDLVHYISPFLYEADLELEAKHKNVAVADLYNKLKLIEESV